MDRANLLQLMKNVANATPSSTFSYNSENLSYDAMNETLRNELNVLVGAEIPEVLVNAMHFYYIHVLAPFGWFWLADGNAMCSSVSRQRQTKVCRRPRKRKRCSAESKK